MENKAKIQERIEKYEYMKEQLIMQQRGCSQLFWHFNDLIWELKNSLKSQEATDTRSVSSYAF